MKHFILLISIISTGFVARSQNLVYDENAEVRTIDKFSGVELSGSMFLYISQGNATALAVSAGEGKYNEKIKTEVKNGVLKISVEGGVWNGFNWTNRKLRAYLTVTDINSLDVSGASYLSISGTLKANDLKLDVSGASEIKGIVDANKLDMDISGASVAKLSGTAKEAMIDASGAAKIDSYNLVIDNCKASCSGAANVKVTVNNELNADASGGSVIYYKGTGVGKVLNTSAGASIKSRSGDDD